MRTGWLVVMAVACQSDPPPALDLDAVVTTARPPKRTEIQAVANEATNAILVFGGNAGPVVSQAVASDFLGDTWLFQPGTGWTEIDAQPKPKRRGRYAMVADEAGHRAFLFGGRYRETGGSGAYDLFGDLWEFSFDSRTWTKLDDGTGPSPRYYPEGVYDPTSGVLYVFGGAQNASAFPVDVQMDLWAWDGERWSELTPSGEGPSTRTFVGVTHDPVRNRLVLFGGQQGDLATCSYNDLWALNLDTLAWEQLHDGSNRAPETRFRANLAYDPVADRYLAFGGHADIGGMNDLWSFDPEANRWERLRTADVLTAAPSGCANAVPIGCLNNPYEVPADYADQDVTAPERRYGGGFVVLHDNVWLTAGLNVDCSDHLDDLWRFDLADGGDWHEVVGARTGESCARRGDDCECLCL